MTQHETGKSHNITKQISAELEGVAGYSLWRDGYDVDGRATRNEQGS